MKGDQRNRNDIVERVENLDSKAFTTLRENYKEAINVLKAYEEVENRNSYVKSSQILEAIDDNTDGSFDYSNSQLSHKLYPLDGIDVIGRWGEGTPAKWDTSEIGEEYLERIEEELDSVFNN